MEIKLNHNNIIPHAVQWKHDHNITSTKLNEVVDHMLRSDQNVRYILVKYLFFALNSNPSKNRYHKYLQNDFEFRIGVSQHFDMTWWNPPFKKRRK